MDLAELIAAARALRTADLTDLAKIAQLHELRGQIVAAMAAAAPDVHQRHALAVVDLELATLHGDPSWQLAAAVDERALRTEADLAAGIDPAKSEREQLASDVAAQMAPTTTGGTT